MTLSWNEIKDRAIIFAKEWEGTSNEEADAKPFLDAFFEVFGVPRRKLGTFEHRVKKLNDADGYIDLFWKGTLLVEMKSRGKNLDKAFKQAKEYTQLLKTHEIPKYILVSDFNEFRLHNLEDDTNHEFFLKDLNKNVSYFSFIIGANKPNFKEQDPANIKAAELLGKFHDKLENIGYVAHPLEVYLVRVLFCLFAEDTGIFERQQFQDFIEQRTAEDGSDLAAKLQELFQVLNTARDKRFKNLDEQLNDFAYINGKLFEEMLPTASFDSGMRKALLDCCYLDWSKISPAIFGSMFQSVMNPKERRNLGAHYTSEKNIMKLIKPLFLDELWAEFEKIKHDDTRLTKFHEKIAMLRFLDPACGCGNFLIITYRELRLLELQVILELQRLNKRYHQMDFIDISLLFKVNVDKFYGIEYEEFPARIAEVAMWLIDHQMNILTGFETGKKLVRVPLVKSATIVHGDALSINWNELLNGKTTIKLYANHVNIINTVQEPRATITPQEYDDIVAQGIVPYANVNLYTNTSANKTEVQINKEEEKIHYENKFDYIFGNPPFIGSKVMNQPQRNSVVKEFNNSQGSGVLDYVAAWYIKAAKYIQGTTIKVAFVSTNSIVQGEQTGILWGQMFSKYNIKIHFAHRTFKWNNEAKGNAAVYCVIVGFANYDTTNKSIFDYEDIKGEAHELKAKNINPYLADARDIFIEKRRVPICKVPQISFGNMPIDGGNLLLNDGEKKEYLEQDPLSKKYIKPFTGAQEFLNGQKKWCLWFRGLNPKDLDKMPLSYKRIKGVENIRKNSAREATRNLSIFPSLFAFISQPESNYILIPRVSSENRKIIPMGFFSPNNIIGDTCLAISNAKLYHLGVLQSSMHMAWIKTVCGRLKSDFRYSNTIVYNNYPWPEDVTSKQTKAIETAIQKILNIRLEITDCPLGKMYDNTKVPPALIKAHNELDKAVDSAYRSQPFTSDGNRMEFLFDLYEKYTADLFTKEKIKKPKNKK